MFIDHRAIASHRFGALVRALIAHWDAYHEQTWTNRVDFLKAASE